jgi:hypothetical protein
VVALTLVLIYIIKLGGLALETHAASQAERRMDAEVTVLRRQVEALETAAIEAESDETVERWAREKKNMARAGDHVVVPVAATEVAAIPAAPESAPEPSAWERFVGWLKGEAPASPASP